MTFPAAPQYTVWPSSTLANLVQATTPVIPSGITTARPVTPPTGQMFLDTTLGYAIWYITGTGWVNASGSVV